jgi:hypothetical protein
MSNNMKIKEIEIFTIQETGFMPEDEYNKITMSEYSDGSMSFSDTHTEGWIYLYPDQVKELKKFLGGK